MVEGIIVGVVVGALMILVNAIVRRTGSQARRVQTEGEAIRRGLMALLRSHIMELWERCVERGYVHIHTMEIVQDMYDQYHDLGGNGTVTKLVEDLKKLPVR